jgi:hypothetical protein
VTGNRIVGEIDMTSIGLKRMQVWKHGLPFKVLRGQLPNPQREL